MRTCPLHNTNGSIAFVNFSGSTTVAPRYSAIFCQHLPTFVVMVISAECHSLRCLNAPTTGSQSFSLGISLPETSMIRSNDTLPGGGSLSASRCRPSAASSNNSDKGGESFPSLSSSSQAFMLFRQSCINVGRDSSQLVACELELISSQSVLQNCEKPRIA